MITLRPKMRRRTDDSSYVLHVLVKIYLGLQEIGTPGTENRGLHHIKDGGFRVLCSVTPKCNLKSKSP